MLTRFAYQLNLTNYSTCTCTGIKYNTSRNIDIGINLQGVIGTGAFDDDAVNIIYNNALSKHIINKNMQYPWIRLI